MVKRSSKYTTMQKKRLQSKLSLGLPPENTRKKHTHIVLYDTCVFNFCIDLLGAATHTLPTFPSAPLQRHGDTSQNRLPITLQEELLAIFPEPPRLWRRSCF